MPIDFIEISFIAEGYFYKITVYHFVIILLLLGVNCGIYIFYSCIGLQGGNSNRLKRIIL